MKRLLIALSALGLAACDSNGEPRQPRVDKVFEVDGCEVKYVYHPNLPNFYIARCDGTITTTWRRSAGKTQVTEATINVDSSEELRKRLAAVEAREKALNKLTPEEKAALGLK